MSLISSVEIKNIRQTQIAWANKAAAKAVRVLKVRHRYVDKLISYGLISESRRASFLKYGQYNEIGVDKLAKLRMVFDKVLDTKNYTIDDARQNTVRVHLDIGMKDDEISFYYVKQLDSSSPCKITRASYETIVCEQ